MKEVDESTRTFILGLLCPIIGNPIIPHFIQKALDKGKSVSVSPDGSTITFNPLLSTQYVVTYLLIVLAAMAICCAGFYFVKKLKEIEGFTPRRKVLQILTVVVLIIDFICFYPIIFFGSIMLISMLISGELL